MTCRQHEPVHSGIEPQEFDAASQPRAGAEKVKYGAEYPIAGSDESTYGGWSLRKSSLIESPGPRRTLGQRLKG